MSSMKKDIDAVISAALAQGWRHCKTANGHHQMYSPDKHTIVVASDKSTDTHSFNNFLSEMKKGGYVECDAQRATHSLGSALLAAKKVTPQLDELSEPPPTQRLTLPQIVIGFLERRDAACTTEDIVMVVKHHRPLVERQSIVSQLSALAASGRIRHIARGLYGAVKEEAAPPPVAARTVPVDKGKVHVVPMPSNNGIDHSVEHMLQNKSAIQEELSFQLRNEAIVQELFVMQSSLVAALGRVESIVQKLRATSAASG